VPAYPDAPRQSTPLRDATSVSPDPPSSASDGQDMGNATPAPKRKRQFLNVDFSGYRPDASERDPVLGDGGRDAVAERSPAASSTGEDFTIQAQLAAAAAEGMQLDPALLQSGRSTSRQPDNDAEGERLRPDRRAQLMREAEEMRAALRAKEREIDELT